MMRMTICTAETMTAERKEAESMSALSVTLREENHACKRYDGKPLLGAWVVVAVTPGGELREWVRAVTTGNPGGRVYANVWIKGNVFLSTGGGVAGGGGYHKASAAVGDALADAGVILPGNINGAGDGAIREALLAVAQAIGAENPAVFTVGAAS